MNRSRWVGFAGVLLLVMGLGCSDPYKQTVEPTGSQDYSSFVEAMKKLPIEEKNLVNAYVARMESQGVRPVGVTVREAIDEQRRHEAEQAALPSKLIDGAVKIAQALSPKPQAPLPTVPPPFPTATVPGAVPTVPPAPATAPLPTVPPPPATTVTAPPFTPITGLELSALLQEIDAEPFPDKKVALIKEKGETRYFTTRQALALAQTVAFPAKQVEVLSSLYLHVVDPETFDEEAYRIFTFDTDRKALKDRVSALRGR